MEDYKKALESNKDDTGNLVIVLGEYVTKIEELEERVSKLEKRNFNSYIFTTTTITLLSGTIAAIGGIEACNGSTNGINYVKASCAIFLGLQLVYQSGHWIFKWF